MDLSETKIKPEFLTFKGSKSFNENEYKLVYDKDQLFHTLSQNVNEAVYRCVYGKGLIYVNDSFLKIFGYSDADEVLNKKTARLYNDRNVQKQLGEEIIQKGFITNREVEFRRKDGTIFIGSCSSIKVEENGTIYFDGAIRDISNEKEAQKKLEYQARMHQTLINISSKFINQPLEEIFNTIESTLSEIGNFLEVDQVKVNNYQFEECTYETRYEWSSSMIAYPEKEIGEKIIRSMMLLHQKGEHYHIVNSGKKLNGFQSVLSAPMMIESKCVGFVSFESKNERSYTDGEVSMIKLFANMLVNIANRANNQLQLNKLVETTSIQNKRLKDFSQITSHNIRSSTSNLMAINQMLHDDAQNPIYLNFLDATVDKLNISVSNLNHLLNFDMINEVLERTDCNISESINQALAYHKLSIEKHQISINNSLPSKILIPGFAPYFDTIFQHLLSNAIKHGTGESKAQIDIGETRNNNETRIFIKDYGPGIDLDRYEGKIFNAGVRLSSDQSTGQGMGLFIVKYMVETLGGQIRLLSRPNKGTTCEVVFPVSL